LRSLCGTRIRRRFGAGAWEWMSRGRAMQRGRRSGRAGRRLARSLMPRWTLAQPGLPHLHNLMNYFDEKLANIEPTSGHRVWLEFEDGFTAELDLAPLLDEGPIFAPMRDPAVFATVKLEWGVPVWSDDLDLSPGSLRPWAEEGRVLSIEETDEWVAKHPRQRRTWPDPHSSQNEVPAIETGIYYTFCERGGGRGEDRGVGSPWLALAARRVTLGASSKT
jgi:hypothetical protein